MARNEVTDKDLGYRPVVNRMIATKDFGVTAGVHADAGSYPDGTAVSDVAVYNEFGTRDIKPRPFVRSTMDEKEPEYGRLIEKLMGDYVDGRINLQEIKQKFGRKMVDDIQKKILNWRSPKNEPSTIASKGFNDPLVNTRRLYDAITYEED